MLALLGAFWLGVFAKNPVAVCLFLFILIAGDLEYRTVKRRERQTAEWERLIRELSRRTDAGNGTSADLLHGPN